MYQTRIGPPDGELIIFAPHIAEVLLRARKVIEEVVTIVAITF